MADSDSTTAGTNDLSSKDVKLWADIPAEQRVDREFIEGCHGAYEPDGAAWVDRHIERLENPKCPAAVQWGQSGRYRPCFFTPLKGETFCVFHGGAKRITESASSREMWRLYARRDLLVQRIATMQAELDGIEPVIAAVEAVVSIVEIHEHKDRSVLDAFNKASDVDARQHGA